MNGDDGSGDAQRCKLCQIVRSNPVQVIDGGVKVRVKHMAAKVKSLSIEVRCSCPEC